ncbi:MAG: MG2 domain-containing protein, partial [bacterium]
LRGATGMRKALLHSMRASALSEYLAEQRWRLYNRSETLERSEDIRTWSATDLHRQIAADHLAALSERAKLSTFSTAGLSAALIAGDLIKRRPTLYDLVVHAALDHFTRDERDINRFAGGFELNDPLLFAPAPVFTKLPVPATDSLSLELKAIRLFQEALAWHLNDRAPEAVIDLDLRRLAFVHDRSVDPDRDQQYAAALKELADRYAKDPASAQAQYLKAALDHRLAEGSMRAGRPDRQALRNIEAECNRIIARHPGSEGALNAAILLESLRKPELNLQVELMNIPGHDFRCRVAYRNLQSIHYRIIPLSDSLTGVLTGLSGNDHWKRLASLPVVRSESQVLPYFDDLRTHAVEIRIRALPAGRYLVLASADPAFQPGRQPMAATGFHITRIAWINRGNDYFVLDRESGTPLHDAKVRIWQTQYGYGERRPLLRLEDSVRTDLNGHFLMPPPDMHAWGGRRLEVEWRGDRVFPDARDHAEWPDDRPWINDREEYERRYRRLFLFTDRSIYRPGQTVHFKGLLVSRDPDTRRPKIVEGWERMLKLTNANGDEIDSIVLRTGVYGSFHGSFRLPERGLTGTFRIADRDLGSISIQVEEYKRPTFEVTWTSTQDEYKVYDTVKATGIATSYAGAALNGARVKYRVERIARFPYPWRWHYFGWGEPPAGAMEISHGTATTDENGKFDIRFAAVPDKKIDPSLLPVFEYRITADVTDLNGETRSGDRTLPVGYHSLNLEIVTGNGGDPTNAADASITLKASNLEGLPRMVKATLELRPLRSPQRLIRPRLWAAPDTFLMSETEYIRYFPFDEYAREAQPETWATGPVLFRSVDSLRDGRSDVRLPLKAIKAGWYRIMLTATDKRGMPVTAQRDIRVTDAQTGQAGPAWLTVHANQETAQPGDRIRVTLSTADRGLHLIQLLDGYQGQVEDTRPESGRKTPQRMSVPEGPGGPFRFPELGSTPASFVIPVTDADRGGFAVSHAFVRQNRMYGFESLIEVPWSDRELDIQTETWRDRTLPGSAEEWTVKVRGSKGEAVAAEMLMSMYDASLDQFRGHAWQKPELFEVWPARFDRYLKKPWNSHHFRSSDGRTLDAIVRSLPR